MYTKSSSFAPLHTPQAVRLLVILTVSFSLSIALINPLFTYLFQIPGPYSWFSLSKWGMEKYFFWQPLTALFLQPGGPTISFSLLISLTIQMAILWAMGSQMCERIGEKSFLRFYFTIGTLSNLFGYGADLLLGGWGLHAGSFSPVLAVLFFWTLESPNAVLFLFSLIPVQAKWLTAGIVGAVLLVALSSYNVFALVGTLTALFMAYLYGLIGWGFHVPIPNLYQKELKLIRLYEKVRKALSSKKSHRGSPTVVQFPFSKKEKEDLFVNQMLEKIAKYGKDSLSKEEIDRLSKISKSRQGL